MYTESGEAHGCINELPNSCSDKGCPNMTPERKSEYEKLRKHESKMVKARYINHRGMHERLSRPYMRYAGDPIRLYNLIPGHVYDLPRGFVDEINNHRGLAQRGERLIDDKIISKDQNPLRIHELVPISF